TQRRQLGRVTVTDVHLVVNRSERDGIAVLSVEGELDLDTADQLRLRLEDELTRHDIILEFSRVPFMDSISVGVLVAAHHLSQRTGHKMAIAAASPPVHDLLTLCRLHTVICLCPDVATALTCLTAAGGRDRGSGAVGTSPHRT
ncbi:MAG: STAS domain-containing protein, partial [Actinocatenispora sp.]